MFNHNTLHCLKLHCIDCLILQYIPLPYPQAAWGKRRQPGWRHRRHLRHRTLGIVQRPNGPEQRNNGEWKESTWNWPTKLATPLVISSIILSVIRWVPCGPSFGHSFEILLAIRSNYSTIQFCEEVNNFEPYSPGDNTNCKGPCKVLRGWCISFKIS